MQLTHSRRVALKTAGSVVSGLALGAVPSQQLLAATSRFVLGGVRPLTTASSVGVLGDPNIKGPQVAALINAYTQTLWNVVGDDMGDSSSKLPMPLNMMIQLNNLFGPLSTNPTPANVSNLAKIAAYLNVSDSIYPAPTLASIRRLRPLTNAQAIADAAFLMGEIAGVVAAIAIGTPVAATALGMGLVVGAVFYLYASAHPEIKPTDLASVISEAAWGGGYLGMPLTFIKPLQAFGVQGSILATIILVMRHYLEEGYKSRNVSVSNTLQVPNATALLGSNIKYPGYVQVYFCPTGNAASCIGYGKNRVF